jgi:putative chitinase
MAKLTPAHLRAIMPNIPQNDEVTEFPACCATMRRFDITNKRRAAAWLGNVAKESGELFYTEEIASGAAYEGRVDLGNIHPGDGVRFKGRGYIQITGRANYRRIAQALRIRCVVHPDLLEKMPHRWTTAGYFWKNMSSLGNLNVIAEQGNVERTVLGVRGGPDPQRRVYYDRAMRVLPNDLSIPNAP